MTPAPNRRPRCWPNWAARKRWRPSSAPTCPAAGCSRSPRRRKRGPAPARPRPPSRCRPVRGRLRGGGDRTILLIILAVVLFPLWIGLAGTIFGILMGVVGAAIGFFFGGVGTVVGIVAVLVANTPAAFAAGWPTGLFMVGMCLLALALGIALIAVAVWLVTWLLPACWRLTKRAWRALTGKKEAK